MGFCLSGNVYGVLSKYFCVVQERSWICGFHALVMCWCKWDWQCPY